VVPRSDGGTSGALVLALSLGLPVIAARKPAYEELLQGGAAGWLFSEGDAASLRACLAEASVDREAAHAKGAVALALAGAHGWQDVGEETASAITALARSRGGGRCASRAGDLAIDG
jgi:glycosyltransferase involved in cell wall biosynthesis